MNTVSARASFLRDIVDENPSVTQNRWTRRPDRADDVVGRSALQRAGDVCVPSALNRTEMREKMRTEEDYVNESDPRAPYATVQDALSELPMLAAMVAAANVAVAVVLFQRAGSGVARRLGFADDVSRPGA